MSDIGLIFMQPRRSRYQVKRDKKGITHFGNSDRGQGKHTRKTNKSLPENQKAQNKSHP